MSRSLAACEGALLVVDASQGIEAQTLANVYLALENDLEIIPVLNKIDLPAADPDRVASEIEETIGLDCTDIIQMNVWNGLFTIRMKFPNLTNGGPIAIRETRIPRSVPRSGGEAGQLRRHRRRPCFTWGGGFVYFF